MSVNLYRAEQQESEDFLSRLAEAEHAIIYARLPFKSQFSFGDFRCRMRVLGNRQRFAIALTMFVGRIPFSGENRALRQALLSLDGLSLAGGVAKLEIKSDNWVIATVRFPIMAEPTRLNLACALSSKLMQLHPALKAVKATTICD